MPKEAQSRIKINQLLEAAGWRFFDSAEGRSNRELVRRFEAKIKTTIDRVWSTT